MYKILIVDDEEAIRTGLTIGVDWSLLNCHVIGSACDGLKALEIIEQEMPDIILSDIVMQPMSGLELCEVVSQSYPHIKFILLTGLYDFDNACKAITYGVVELLLKPTSPAKISAAVHRAIGKINESHVANTLSSEIQHQAIENLALKQSLLLQNIFSAVDYGADLPHLLASANINLIRYYVITILVEGSSIELPTLGLYSHSEQIIRKYLLNTFRQLSCYTANCANKCIRIVVETSDVKDFTLSVLHECCHELSAMIDNLTDFYITVGISNPHTDVAELYTAAQESDNASHFAVYSADDPIIDYASLPVMSNKNMSEIKSRMDQLSASIRKLDLYDSDSQIQALSDYCISHRVQFMENYNICLYLLNVCYQQFLNYDVPGFALNEQYSLSKKLQDCKTIEAQYMLLQDTVHLLFHAMRIKSNSSDLINRICSYIQDNYQQPLSLESIADVFSISAGYLGRVFKKNTNVNLSTYIQKTRIDHAKILITTSNLHTYEIAEAVGIQDPVYFSKLFKKCTGQRVRDFRANHLHSQEEETKAL